MKWSIAYCDCCVGLDECFLYVEKAIGQCSFYHGKSSRCAVAPMERKRGGRREMLDVRWHFWQLPPARYWRLELQLLYALRLCSSSRVRHVSVRWKFRSPVAHHQLRGDHALLGPPAERLSPLEVFFLRVPSTRETPRLFFIDFMFDRSTRTSSDV